MAAGARLISGGIGTNLYMKRLNDTALLGTQCLLESVLEFIGQLTGASDIILWCSSSEEVPYHHHPCGQGPALSAHISHLRGTRVCRRVIRMS